MGFQMMGSSQQILDWSNFFMELTFEYRHITSWQYSGTLGLSFYLKAHYCRKAGVLRYLFGDLHRLEAPASKAIY